MGDTAGEFDDLLTAPQRRLESLQRSIDERIKSSVGRITGHPAFQNEVRRIERSLATAIRVVDKLDSAALEQRTRISRSLAGEIVSAMDEGQGELF